MTHPPTTTNTAGKKPTWVLLHGAGLGPWIWDDVRTRLQGASIAPTYPGRQPGATPDSCAEAVAEQIIRESNGAHSPAPGAREGGDCIVVLHSLTGVLAGSLALQLGTRLRRLVLLSAVVPPPGQSFAHALGFPARLVLPILFRFRPNGLKPSPALIRGELCNDLAPEQAETVVSRYEAEFPGPYLTPPRPLDPKIPRTYIKLTQDRSLPPRLQEKVMRGLSISDRHEIDAGHLAMLSQPERLAEILDTLCAQESMP